MLDNSLSKILAEVALELGLGGLDHLMNSGKAGLVSQEFLPVGNGRKIVVIYWHKAHHFIPVPVQEVSQSSSHIATVFFVFKGNKDKVSDLLLRELLMWL